MFTDLVNKWAMLNGGPGSGRHKGYGALSTDAEAKTQKAMRSGKWVDHRSAYDAHNQARTAARDAAGINGDMSKAAYHAGRMAYHKSEGGVMVNGGPGSGPRKRFDQVPVGGKFEFTGPTDFPLSGMERGPWKKISQRKYTPFDAEHRLSGHSLSVGSAKTSVFHDESIANSILNGGPGSGIKGHQTAPQTGGKAVPGINDWNQFAGGTSAAEGKHSYQFNHPTGQTYSIDPISNQYGRHQGYRLGVYPAQVGLHGTIDQNGNEQSMFAPLHRTPAQAVTAAKLHAANVEANPSRKQSVEDYRDKSKAFRLSQSNPANPSVQNSKIGQITYDRQGRITNFIPAAILNSVKPSFASTIERFKKTPVMANSAPESAKIKNDANPPSSDPTLSSEQTPPAPLTPQLNNADLPPQPSTSGDEMLNKAKTAPPVTDPKQATEAEQKADLKKADEQTAIVNGGPGSGRHKGVVHDIYDVSNKARKPIHIGTTDNPDWKHNDPSKKIQLVPRNSMRNSMDTEDYGGDGEDEAIINAGTSDGVKKSWEVRRGNLPAYPYNFGKSANQEDHFVMGIAPNKTDGGYKTVRWHRLSTDNPERAEKWKAEKVQSIKDEMAKNGLKSVSHIISATGTGEPKIEHTTDKALVNAQRIVGKAVEIKGERLSNSAFKADPSGWMHLSPVGEYENANAGVTQVLSPSSHSQMVAAFNSQRAVDPNHMIILDFDHSSDTTPNTAAAGWIDALRNDASGLWGHAKMTPEGDQAVSSGTYRFVSPVFTRAMCLQDGTPDRLIPQELSAVALTNKPNLPVRVLSV